MKKTIILYAGSIAESVTSAAIQAVASSGSLCIDIEKETFKPNDPKVEYDVYPMCDAEIPKAENVTVTITKPLSAKKKDYRRRLLLVWERCFHEKTRPRLIHLLGGYQVNERDEADTRAVGFAVVATLNQLDDQGIAKWKTLLLRARTNNALSALISDGKAIEAYVNSIGLEEAELNSGSSEELAASNEEFANDVLELELKLKGKEDELKKKEKELKWWKDKVSDGGLLFHCTVKEIKNIFTVKKLKAYCKEQGLKNYTKLKEEELIKFIKDFLGAK